MVIVSDQRSEDDSRAICREFPRVIVLESSESRVCEQARWQLLDAARSYDGRNLLWWSDADELVSPRLANAWVQSMRDRLEPGTAIDCLFYHLWGSLGHYRNDVDNGATRESNFHEYKWSRMFDSAPEMSCHILPNSNVLPGGIGELGIPAATAAAANAWARATGKQPRNFPLNEYGA